MYKLHQIERVNFWFNAGAKLTSYSLTYNEKDNVIHVLNHTYPNSYSLYSALESSSDEFIGKLRNQLKFAMKSEVPANARIFFYDRSKIIYEWDRKENACKPLLKVEDSLVYSPYNKQLLSLKSQKGHVYNE